MPAQIQTIYSAVGAVKCQILYVRRQSKKIEKNFEKSVDKTLAAWYYSQALERDGKKRKAERLNERSRRERKGP